MMIKKKKTQLLSEMEQKWTHISMMDIGEWTMIHEINTKISLCSTSNFWLKNCFFLNFF